jgi:hypothetical protein
MNEPTIKKSFCTEECRKDYREERISGIELPANYIEMCVSFNLCPQCGNNLRR